MNDRTIRLQPKQEEFLSSSADIVIGGGSAGGGKTWSLLIEPLRHVRKEGFNAVILRRTYPEITKVGGIWDDAGNIYPLIGGIPRYVKLEYLFSKSRISFGHLLNDKALDNWKSSQISLLEFDQLETFTERQFFYMLSRVRSVSGVQGYVRATANPEPNWLADFLSWWIADDGYADLSRAGKHRAFVRKQDEIIWADTKQELIDRYPDLQPMTVTFIPFTVYDNPLLLEKDPSYISKLQSLGYVDQLRLLGDRHRGGNWKIKPAAGKVFNRDWFQTVSLIPSGGVACRFFDFAGTLKQAASSDPDYTAGVLIKFVNGSFYVMDCFADHVHSAEVERVADAIMWNDYEQCRISNTQYMARWEEEPGSASMRDSHKRVQRLAGIDARGVRATKNKLSNWQPLAAMALGRNVFVLESNWTENFLNHMHGLPDIAHDDIGDAAAGSYNQLTALSTLKAGSSQG